MRDFQFSLPTKIIFGKNSIAQLPVELKALNVKKMLLVYGCQSIKSAGIYDKVMHQIRSSQTRVTEYPDCVSNPDVTYINKGAEIVKSHNIDFILAVGGGSVIDAAKAIAFLANNIERDIWQYKTQKSLFSQPSLPVGAVLTTAGTGSEVNGGFVIDNRALAEKFTFAHLSTRPVFACCNPEFTFSLDKETTRNNLVDILSHLLEQYFSNDDDLFYIDDLILSSITFLIDKSKAILAEPYSYESRANMMLASSFGLSYAFSIGKEIHWILHHLAHALSGIDPISHGQSLALLMPGWLDYLSRTKAYQTRAEHLHRRLSGDPSLNPAAFFANFLNAIGMPREGFLSPGRQLAIVDKLMQNKDFMSRTGLTERDIIDMLSYDIGA